MCTPVAPALWEQRQEDHWRLVISFSKDERQRVIEQDTQHHTRTPNIMQTCTHTRVHTHIAQEWTLLPHFPITSLLRQ